MKIIDTHLHFSKIESFEKTARDISFVDYSEIGLKREFENNIIVAGIGMGVTEEMSGGFPDVSSSNPMNLNLEDNLPSKLAYCVGINPVKLVGESNQGSLLEIRKKLKE